jgi:hypothetical protein
VPVSGTQNRWSSRAPGSPLPRPPVWEALAGSPDDARRRLMWCLADLIAAHRPGVARCLPSLAPAWHKARREAWAGVPDLDHQCWPGDLG